MSPSDAQVTHPLGSGSIPASDAQASRREVTVSDLTILHKPPPAGPKELTDLISSLNNCPTGWHVADGYVCVLVLVRYRGSYGEDRWQMAEPGLK